MPSNNVLVEIKDVSKHFPGVKALDHVSLSIRRGEVHALSGENGAGKSTLIKILTGVYTYDEGSIIFDGSPVAFKSTNESQKAGIGSVYQELNMIPYLSVAENIYIGDYPMGKTGIDWKELYENAQKQLDSLNIDVDAKKQLNELSTAQQQMVSIVRAVSRDCKLIILDEPTSSLDTKEVKTLFSLVRQLKEKGVAFIFVTHRMEEIYQICDRITVLKDGQFIGTYQAEDLNQYQLVTLMVGREITQQRKQTYFSPEKDQNYVVEVRNLAKKPKVKDVSFGISRGEIVGLAGLLGSGRTEVAEMLFGSEMPDAGEILYEGILQKNISPTKAVRAGLAFCTENRRLDGIVPNMSVKNNIVLACMKQISRLGFVISRKRLALVNRYIEELRIKTPTPEQRIRNLSGGNQQKALLARWMATNPKLIILDEPTRGIDVGAKQEVERLVQQIASQGIGVLLISSEIPELVRNCDRVIVLREGEQVGELAGAQISEKAIMQIIAQNYEQEVQWK
ncbi:MAG: sugar ABC transporter ATP-binding protein [Oscillospiraceae bacterium]